MPDFTQRDDKEAFLLKHIPDLKPLLVKKSMPLLYQGEIPTKAFFIKRGVVKIYNITSAGEEKVVGYQSSGGLMPVAWVFGLAPVSLYYYDTYTDCELYRLSKEEILKLLKTEPQVTQALLKDMVSMYMGATTHLHALEQSRARDKLLYIMQYLVLRFGEKIDDKYYRINLRLTHQEIANLIGTTRETVSTEISKLAKEGTLKIVKNFYVINYDKALRLLGEEDFSQLSL